MDQDAQPPYHFPSSPLFWSPALGQVDPIENAMEYWGRALAHAVGPERRWQSRQKAFDRRGGIDHQVHGYQRRYKGIRLKEPKNQLFLVTYQ